MTMEETRLADYRPFPWRIDTVVLHVALDPEATAVHARLAIEAAPGGESLKLDGDSLTLDMVAIDDVPLASSAYHHDETGLVIHEPPRPLYPGDPNHHRAGPQRGSGRPLHVIGTSTARSARPRDFAASPSFPTVPTCLPPIPSPSMPIAAAVRFSFPTAIS